MIFRIVWVIWTDLSSILSQSTHLTDRRTNSFLIACSAVEIKRRPTVTLPDGLVCYEMLQHQMKWLSEFISQSFEVRGYSPISDEALIGDLGD